MEDYTVYKSKPKYVFSKRRSGGSPMEDYTVYRSKPKYTFSKKRRRGSSSDYTFSNPFAGNDYLGTMNNDQLYEIAKKLNGRDLMNFCTANKRINTLCKTEQRFIDLIPFGLYPDLSTSDISSSDSDKSSSESEEELSGEGERISKLSSYQYPFTHLGERRDVKRFKRISTFEFDLFVYTSFDLPKFKSYLRKLLRSLPIKPNVINVTNLGYYYRNYKITVLVEYRSLTKQEKQPILEELVDRIPGEVIDIESMSMVQIKDKFIR